MTEKTNNNLYTNKAFFTEHGGGSESDYDVIKYDYQLMDYAYWILTENGYKIVER